MPERLTILTLGKHTRLGDILAYALDGVDFNAVTAEEMKSTDLRGRRILFALSLDESGLADDFMCCIRYLRTHFQALDGATGAILVDSATELYTKEIARTLVFDANCSGCRFPGRGMVEATKSLKNFDVLCGVYGVDRYTAYQRAVRLLIERLCSDVPAQFERPKVLWLHASDKARSNAFALGSQVTERLADCCEINEISMQASPINDCNGCSYKTCQHYAEQETCFYGGILPEAVFPAIMACDALLLCCSNYNDAPGAHFLALNNRLNALLLRGKPFNKALFAIVVSGYSGGDLVAKQLMGGFCLNKPCCLPPRFALLETANDPGTVLQEMGVFDRIAAYADQIQQELCIRETARVPCAEATPE
ncbi:MAG: NAD(P)H-dependent oxidoreductase [Clostridia bacterium]